MNPHQGSSPAPRVGSRVHAEQGPLVRFKITSENGDEAMDVFGAAYEQDETQELAVAA